MTALTPTTWLSLVLRWIAVLALLIGTPLAAQNTARNFDHLKTGFALTGIHGSARCESCHINGVFKGTPRDCASCHSGSSRIARNNVLKPAQHISTQLSCDSCHNTQTFVGARFNHVSVVVGTCSTCHNGVQAAGKSTNHISTQASCDSCHSTAAWKPAARFDHSSLPPASVCASCHNGTSATGKSAAHIPVATTNCSSCHSTSSWSPSKWNHTQLSVANNCSSCHTGAFPPAKGRSGTHIPYQSISNSASANCDTCHKSGFSSFTPARFHANVAVTSQCATCHLTGSYGQTGRPSTAIHNGVTGNCESCHKSTSAWAGAKVDHSGFTTATNCTSCHNGSTARGKDVSHIVVGNMNCVSCHTTASWTPSKWNHTQISVSGACASCHDGLHPPADGRSSHHIPYQTLSGTNIASCDSCHKSGFGSWTPARFHSSVAITTQCSTCHLTSSFGLTGKPATAIHSNVTGNCESCHKSTSAWAGARVDHSTFTVATNCASCHNGSTARGKETSHIGVGATNCISCHNTTGWIPTKWNHTQVTVTNTCASCHDGAHPPADGRSATHIPYASLSGAAITNCDSCHKSGFTLWTGARFHSSVAITTQCATCHLTSAYGLTAKATTAIHNGVTGNCESCHKSTSSWIGARVDHSTFTSATNCASCHNGTTARGKETTHIGVGATNCVTCHNTTGWIPSKWNHTQVPVANTCATCHDGAHPPADGRSATHIPYATLSGTAITNCDTCHKSGFTLWTGARFHSSVAITTQCATCHLTSAYGLTAKATTAIHNGVTGNCESCHKSTSSWIGARVDHSTFTTATNCASCHNGTTARGKETAHIGVGATNCITCHNTTGWIPTKWNHTQVTVVNTCSTCHDGAHPPADGRSATHIPYASLSGAAITNCDTCHKSGFTLWTGARFHSSVAITTQCATCHLTSAYGLTAKATTAIHNGVTGNCESCHKSTSSWLGARVDHSTFTTATNCATCHNGTTARGKETAHIGVGATNCITCHNTTGWIPSKWNHTQVPVVNTCASCHDGAHPPADGRSATHIPYTTLSGTAITNCDTCHKSGFTLWTGARFHSSVAMTTQCSTCHLTSAYGLTAKPATVIHNGVTGNCESCHKSTSSWLGARVDHSTFTTATNCASCHNGTTARGKEAAHIGVGATNCITCHNTTGWIPSKWNHTQLPVVNTCSTCHDGAHPPADGRSTNHIPYQTLTGVAITNCDTCHKSGYALWSGARFHSSVSISTQCATCHLTAAYGRTSKPATPTHSAVTGNCESCHKSTASWLTVVFAHSPANAVGTGTCDTCHNGTNAKGKSSGHIPIPAGTARCDSCHRSQVSFATAMTMNHTVVTTGECKSCHNGSYTTQGPQGAMAKVANHIPEAQLLNGASMDCKACHTSTTTWTAQRMNHNASMGNGAGWCKSCHVTGTSYLGNMNKMSLNHRGGTSIKTDCSQSGCHRPLGTFGTAYTKWN